MTNCGAPGCKNRSTENKGISFHRLPTTKRNEIRKKWLQNIRRKIVPLRLYICSEHFESSCFQRDLKAELTGTKPRNMLKDEAVPTIFSHMSGSSKKRISALQREEKQLKKVMVEDAISSFDETANIVKKEEICCTSNPMAVKDCREQKQRTKSQFEEHDSERNKETKVSARKTPPLKIRFDKRKRRTKDIAINTDLSFDPNAIINISVDHKS